MAIRPTNNKRQRGSGAGETPLRGVGGVIPELLNSVLLRFHVWFETRARAILRFYRASFSVSHPVHVRCVGKNPFRIRYSFSVGFETRFWTGFRKLRMFPLRRRHVFSGSRNFRPRKTVFRNDRPFFLPEIHESRVNRVFSVPAKG